jgi:hypothetical protein
MLRERGRSHAAGRHGAPPVASEKSVVAHGIDACQVAAMPEILAELKHGRQQREQTGVVVDSDSRAPGVGASIYELIRRVGAVDKSADDRLHTYTLVPLKDETG